jgi:preprotein translocase subunit SecB
MTENTNPEFAIMHIYVKDLSFESPLPMHLLDVEWKPDAQVSMNHEHQALGDDNYNVTVKVSIDVKINDKNIFIAEIEQSGTFLLKNFNEEQLDHVLKAYCPNTLLPYARQTLSDTIVRGGFPPLFIGPVDFESQYAKEKNSTN